MKKNKYKFKELVNVLEKELQLLKPHSPVPSLNELIERFPFSQTTAKRAMLELQHRGLIYSRVGSGSFVAPLAKRNTILIVFELDISLKNRDMFNQEFLVSALVQCNRLYPSYTVMAMDFAEFKLSCDTLDVCYPNLKGVIILRNISEYRSLADSLEKRGIPTCFYGSSSYVRDLKKMDYLIYNENLIMKTALDALVKRNCARIGYAKYPEPDFPVTQERQTQLERLLRQGRIKAVSINHPGQAFNSNGITCLGDDRIIKDELRAFFAQIDGMVCYTDYDAILFSRSAMELGFKVPDEVAVVGVNNFSFYNQPYPGITTVDLNTVSDAGHCIDLLMGRISNGRHFQEETQVRLIRRETA